LSLVTNTVKDLEVVIGLEIHIELLTSSKMFCACQVGFGGQPNTRVCPVCLGLPGSLPVANKKAVEYVIELGLALDCQIAKFTQFHRKNYFYPDMPKNYQISQYDLPLCTGGYLDVEMKDYVRRVGITRVHLEEDTGKMIHVGGAGRISGANYSIVDFNRAGTPLAEIVTEPDITSPSEAKAFVQQLRDIALNLGISDCNMEEGSLRCDANISLRQPQEDLGTKTEIKNINSFRSLQKALEYEVQRQRRLLASGKKVIQETRHWSDRENKTMLLRSKEEAHDYRYFADPDLVPMEVDEGWIKELRQKLPELPAARRKRFQETYGLDRYTASLVSALKATADYYEATVKFCNNPKEAANWMMGELAAQLNASGKSIGKSPVKPDQLAELIDLIGTGKISGKIAKQVFQEMFLTKKSASAIVKEKGLEQISDTSELEKVIDEVIAGNPKAVQEYKDGKQQILGFLVGQVMKATKGQANPKLTNKILVDKLKVTNS
jgi:aspartyl-tRNA(Asn)/glutamyl-tRNA(Gln) amidotransferase subunit B